MMALGRRAAVLVATMLLIPAVASAAAARVSSAKLPSNACKLLTIAQVQKVLPSAGAGSPIHDKADKQEICNWEVEGTSDYLGVTLQPFTGDATTAKALYGTTDPERKVKGLGSAAAFAPNDSDTTVHAVLGKIALNVKLEREDYDVGDDADVAQLKADATMIAQQIAKKL
jgi:hypothetical protein